MSTVILSNGKSFLATAAKSLLQSGLDSNLVLEHSCATGKCGACRARLISGEVALLKNQECLSAQEIEEGWILTCAVGPMSESIHLGIEDIGVLADYSCKTVPCKIDALELVAPDVIKVTLRFPPSGGVRYLAGQYVDVISARGVKRSYSPSNRFSPNGNLELEVRKVPNGAMSDYFFVEAKRGDLLRLEGPKGTFFLRDVSGLDLVFLATGTGIAPIKAMLEDLSTRPFNEQPLSIRLLWGCRYVSDIYWQPDVGNNYRNFEFIPVLSREDASWAGARGYVQEILLAHGTGLHNSVVYACGSMTMIESCLAKLVAAGFPKKLYFSDAFVSSSN